MTATTTWRALEIDVRSGDLVLDARRGELVAADGGDSWSEAKDREHPLP